MTTVRHSSPLPTSTPPTADRPSAPRRRGPGRRPFAGSGSLFVLPFLSLFALFLVVPIGYGVWMSLTDSSLTGLGDDRFIGFDNYAEALADPQVWDTLGVTLLFTVLASVPLILVALGMAVLVNTGLPGQWLWRLSFFAPFLLPVAVVTMVWSWLFQPELGLLNDLLGYLRADDVGWLIDEDVALLSVALVSVWWHVGFNFLLYLAALQSIPDHLYEAAAIDGAGAWRRLWSVTLPQLRRVTGVVGVLQILASLKVFDQIYLLTQGGPNGATRSVLVYVYDTGFTGYRLGYAAAISYVFFAIIIVLSIAQMKFVSRGED
ncbi:sugar ABC transporter permease [Streptomyces sp. B6B3]|uniref:carbohydrate ABC transporter permease n=1 Tax=Streptomyces sp. B6B3 TaxID=3153570 RepID=UPI00325F12AE